MVPDHGNHQKRWTLFKSYQLEIEWAKYQISYQAFQISCWQIDWDHETTRKPFHKPPRDIKHQPNICFSRNELINPIWDWGEAESTPPKVFINNSKMPGDIEKKLSDFNFTPLMDILRLLSITIAVRCCHSNLLFPMCHDIFGVEKQRNLNYFQDNYLIKLNLAHGAIFRSWIQIHKKF